MKSDYDFTDSQRNPYAKSLKKQITIRLETDVIDYFKAMSQEAGMPYQSLINLYLRECARSGRKISVSWTP